MTDLQAAILGAIQGLTEFLPVSSSGHLVISQCFFGLTEPGIAFDISVHVGTLLAVIIFFRKEVREILSAAASGSVQMLVHGVPFSEIYSADQRFRLAVLIIVGSVPTAIIGLLLNEISERLFSSLTVAGGMLMLTGIILVLTGFLLWATREVKSNDRGVGEFSFGRALIIGVVQGLAIIPGISRSGSTIAAGLLLGLDKETAGTYSFLLSIPAILGAALLHLADGAITSLALKPLLIGTSISFVVGFFALQALMFIVKKGRLHLFAPYCLLVGLAVLIFGV